MINYNKQSGSVLVMGMIFLLVMTLVGVNAMKFTLLDERIAANMRFKTFTFQAAESALAESANYETIQTCLKKGCNDWTEVISEKPYAINGDNTVVATAEMIDAGVGLSPSRFSSDLFSMRQFDISAVSELSQTHAISDHNLRVGRLVPSQ